MVEPHNHLREENKGGGEIYQFSENWLERPSCCLSFHPSLSRGASPGGWVGQLRPEWRTKLNSFYSNQISTRIQVDRFKQTKPTPSPRPVMK